MDDNTQSATHVETIRLGPEPGSVDCRRRVKRRKSRSKRQRWTKILLYVGLNILGIALLVMIWLSLTGDSGLKQNRIDAPVQHAELETMALR